MNRQPTIKWSIDGAKAKRVREALGLTQEEFSTRPGAPKKEAVGRIEHGEPVWHYTVADHIHALGLPPGELDPRRDGGEIVDVDAYWRGELEEKPTPTLLTSVNSDGKRDEPEDSDREREEDHPVFDPEWIVRDGDDFDVPTVEETVAALISFVMTEATESGSQSPRVTAGAKLRDVSSALEDVADLIETDAGWGIMASVFSWRGGVA